MWGRIWSKYLMKSMPALSDTEKDILEETNVICRLLQRFKVINQSKLQGYKSVCDIAFST